MKKVWIVSRVGYDPFEPMLTFASVPHRHATLAEAEKEAKRLASKEGVRFAVLEVVAVTTDGVDNVRVI